jgi:cytochrome c biogenesis protein CcmG/thiol:disulfide interchange protein DsbE
MNRRGFVQSGLAAGAAVMAGRAVSAATDFLPIDEKNYRQFVTGHHGQVLLVDFWATWCAPCRQELPKLVAMAQDYRSKGVVLATISCDEPEKKPEALSFIEQKGAPAPYYIRSVDDADTFAGTIDQKWSESSSALPALFIYDRNGHRVQSFLGDTSIKVIQAAVDKALAAK